MARKTKAGGQGTNPKGPVLIDETAPEAEQVTDAGPASDDAPAPEQTADAPDTADAPSEPAPETAEAETTAAAEAAAQDDKPSGDARDDTPAEDTPAEVAQTDALSDDAPEPDPRPEEPAAVPPPPVPAPVTVQKVGFVPLVLGGAIAAALGFGAAWYYRSLGDTDLTAVIETQSTRIAELEARVAELPTQVPDLAPLQEGIAATDQSVQTLGTRIDGLAGEVSARIAAFDERLTGVERAPGVDGTLAETAIASWQTELDALRAEIAAQQTRMGEIATTAEAELEASRAAAAQVEQDAAAAAQQAITRAALARIQVALDSGMPFDAALADLVASGAEAPAALSDVAVDGVPTLGALREGFPDAARAALATARAEGLADVDSNPVTAFLRNQFDVRSVAPREGDDPDAILSRVGAALNENRLTDALAEIEGLPEVARAEMSGWIGQAEARIAATAAVETLDQSMNN